MSFLEIACFNPASAIIAQSNGASRIELCANQSLGGTTPPLSDLISLKSQLTIPINVMIRTRGGNFVYSSDEVNEMKDEIERFSTEGVDGFVFGVLDTEGKVDQVVCRELVSLCKSRGGTCTFHRALDEIPTEKMEDALEEIIELGFEAVLTSGGAKDAVGGGEVLKRLFQTARGRIEIIVGGGVRSANLEGLMKETGAKWFHSSAIVEEGDIADGEEIGRLSCLLKRQ
ncbi:hypothetical protein VTL71DRAFT_10073 [Oculimacula yallundae]|uniref:Copper homeostasis protein cutC homolog n=1 Tax=Oculimacula yallundae TaxID=86028 RepID=A0ABR4BTC8_9HELO